MNDPDALTAQLWSILLDRPTTPAEVRACNIAADAARAAPWHNRHEPLRDVAPLLDDITARTAWDNANPRLTLEEEHPSGTTRHRCQHHSEANNAECVLEIAHKGRHVIWPPVPPKYQCTHPAGNNDTCTRSMAHQGPHIGQQSPRTLRW